jgi:hypothetical protein
MEGQLVITVGHENLRSEWVLDKPHPNRRFSAAGPARSRAGRAGRRRLPSAHRPGRRAPGR